MMEGYSKSLFNQRWGRRAAELRKRVQVVANARCTLLGFGVLDHFDVNPHSPNDGMEAVLGN
jgi:hypothetical protein